jgi:hypothetical protein
MTDIVERLRSPEVFIDAGGMTSPVAREAAAEIERLRAERDTAEARATAAEAARDALLSNATNAALPALARADRAEAERDRLRKALREIAMGRPDIPEGENGEGPDWPMHVFALVWARYCTELQGIARNALGEPAP